MFAMVLADVEAGAPAIVGAVPVIRWQGNEEATPPAVTAYWLRVTESLVIEQQSSLSGGTGAKRYTSQGIVFTQVFCPASDPAGYTKGRFLARLCRNTFRKREPGELVWFRNAKIVPVGLSNAWYQFNVSATYQFDEII
jgi:hypothetical protein